MISEPETNDNVLDSENAEPETDIASEQDKSVSAQEDAVEAAPAPKRKLNKRIVVAISAAVAAIVLIVVFITVIIPAIKYNKGVSLVESGNYDEAIAVFEELNDYRDADKQIKTAVEKRDAAATEQIISDAKKLYDKGEKLSAYKLLKTAPQREKADGILDEYEEALFNDIKDLFVGMSDGVCYPLSGMKVVYQNGEQQYVEDAECGSTIAFFRTYCTVNDENTNPMEINLAAFFESRNDSPIYPHTVKFKSGNNTVALSVTFDERNANYMGQDGETPIYLEDIKTTISFEEYNKLIEFLSADTDTIKIEFIGNSDSVEHSIKEKDVAVTKDTKQYIEVLYETEYRDCKYIQSEITYSDYEQAAGEMINLIDTLYESGATYHLLAKLDEKYKEICSMEADGDELSAQITTVYNMYYKFFEYCLDPYVHNGSSGTYLADQIYIKTYINTYLSQATPQYDKLVDMLLTNSEGQGES